MMQWEILDKAALGAFIEHVKTADAPVLFNPGTSEGRRTRLPFYTDIFLYRLTNFASMPVFTFHYLSDGNRFFYLDGTDYPLLIVNNLGALRLTPANIMAYLNFYFFAVAQEQGEVFLVHETETYPFHDMATFDVGTGITIGQTPSYNIATESDGAFLVTAPMVSDGTLTRAKIRVDTQGRVQIVSQHILVGGVPQPLEEAQR